MDYGLYYHYSGYTFPHIAERKKRDTFAWYDTNNKTVMEEIMQLDNVFQYNELLHCETLHPLDGVADRIGGALRAPRQSISVFVSASMLYSSRT